MLCRYCTHEAYSNTQSVISSLLWYITLKYLLFNCIKVLTTTHEYESTDNVIKCKFEKNKLNKPTNKTNASFKTSKNRPGVNRGLMLSLLLYTKQLLRVYQQTQSIAYIMRLAINSHMRISIKH